MPSPPARTILMGLGEPHSKYCVSVNIRMLWGRNIRSRRHLNWSRIYNTRPKPTGQLSPRVWSWRQWIAGGPNPTWNQTGIRDPQGWVTASRGDLNPWTDPDPQLSRGMLPSDRVRCGRRPPPVPASRIILPVVFSSSFISTYILI